MTDYTTKPSERPWSRDLLVGDRLTPQQASVLQTHRLAELGIHVAESRDGTFRVLAGCPRYTPLSALGGHGCRNG